MRVECLKKTNTKEVYVDTPSTHLWEGLKLDLFIDERGFIPRWLVPKLNLRDRFGLCRELLLLELGLL